MKFLIKIDFYLCKYIYLALRRPLHNNDFLPSMQMCNAPAAGLPSPGSSALFFGEEEIVTWVRSALWVVPTYFEVAGVQPRCANSGSQSRTVCMSARLPPPLWRREFLSSHAGPPTPACIATESLGDSVEHKRDLLYSLRLTFSCLFFHILTFKTQSFMLKKCKKLCLPLFFLFDNWRIKIINIIFKIYL